MTVSQATNTPTEIKDRFMNVSGRKYETYSCAYGMYRDETISTSCVNGRGFYRSSGRHLFLVDELGRTYVAQTSMRHFLVPELQAAGYKDGSHGKLPDIFFNVKNFSDQSVEDDFKEMETFGGYLEQLIKAQLEGVPISKPKPRDPRELHNAYHSLKLLDGKFCDMEVGTPNYQSSNEGHVMGF